jgi:hypothetical protein
MFIMDARPRQDYIDRTKFCDNNWRILRFKLLRILNVEIPFFWDMTPRTLVGGYPHFGGILWSASSKMPLTVHQTVWRHVIDHHRHYHKNCNSRRYLFSSFYF